MDAKATTIEALKVEWERVRAGGQSAEKRATAVAYCKLRSEPQATQVDVAAELGLNRWTLAKWWQRATREQTGSAVSAEDVATLREEIDRQGPRSPARRYPGELKRRVATWAKGERARGVGAKKVAEQLGLPWESVSRWMKPRPPRGLPRAGLRQVEVLEFAARGSRPTLRSPNGYVVEGLDVAALAELIRRLG